MAVSALALPARAVEVTHVDVHDLAKNKQSLLGQHVVTHGCLVMSPHGQFIEPCGSDNWREATLVWDSDYLGVGAFSKLGIDFSSDVEGDFSGVVIEKVVDWPEPGVKRVFLELRSVAHTVPHEP